MYREHEYPVLEFDGERDALLNPAAFARNPFDTDKLVITFFPEVIEKMLAEGVLETERVIRGENPVTVYRFCEAPDVLLTLGAIGCPACAGNLDMFWGLGIRKVMFCGGGGVLDPSIGTGELVLAEGAIRDEGLSYHYLPASRIVYADKAVTDRIEKSLLGRSVPFCRGVVWTTDALFRETREAVARRKAEGALIVEMEQAGCLAVAAYRGFEYGALLYGGDDVSGENWDERSWRKAHGVRYSLVLLCRDLLLEEGEK